MVGSIKKLLLASGETLINVPADRLILKALGFDEVLVDQLVNEAEDKIGRAHV